MCPWGAGGGTDTVARALAAGMEKELGDKALGVSLVCSVIGGLIGAIALSFSAPLLAGEGLVEITSRKGTFVKDISKRPFIAIG